MKIYLQINLFNDTRDNGGNGGEGNGYMVHWIYIIPRNLERNGREKVWTGTLVLVRSVV